jgi:GAF domain-containing protein
MPGFNPHVLFSREDRRARLDDITARLAEATTSAQVARVLVDETTVATSAVCSMLYLLAPEADHLRVVASKGLAPSTSRRLATVPLTCPLPFATAVRAGRTLWFRDRSTLLRECPDFFGQFPDENIQSLAVLPLRLGEGVLGSLAVGPADARTFTDEDLEFLMVVADAAARAFARLPGSDARTWGRRWLAPFAVDGEGVSDSPVSFVAAPHRTRPALRRRRERFDLARTLRLVARRHLPSFRHAGRALRCEMSFPLIGRWDRRWTERMVGGLLTLALHLVPHTPVTVEIQLEGRDAVIEASYGSDPRPVTPADLARLTRAREEWELDFWLWRALAHTQGGQLSLRQDQRGPIGLRLVLPR